MNKVSCRKGSAFCTCWQNACAPSLFNSATERVQSYVIHDRPLADQFYVFVTAPVQTSSELYVHDTVLVY